MSPSVQPFRPAQALRLLGERRPYASRVLARAPYKRREPGAGDLGGGCPQQKRARQRGKKKEAGAGLVSAGSYSGIWSANGTLKLSHLEATALAFYIPMPISYWLWAQFLAHFGARLFDRRG